LTGHGVASKFSSVIYPLFGGNDVMCKNIFLKDLKKVLGCGVLFQVEEDECFELTLLMNLMYIVVSGIYIHNICRLRVM
jgi:hypothetical protein